MVTKILQLRCTSKCKTSIKKGRLNTWSTFKPWPCGVRAYNLPFTGSDGSVVTAITGVEHKFEHRSVWRLGSEQQLGDTFLGPRTKTPPDTCTETTNKGETTRRERKEGGRCKHSRRTHSARMWWWQWWRAQRNSHCGHRFARAFVSSWNWLCHVMESHFRSNRKSNWRAQSMQAKRALWWCLTHRHQNDYESTCPALVARFISHQKRAFSTSPPGGMRSSYSTVGGLWSSYETVVAGERDRLPRDELTEPTNSKPSVVNPCCEGVDGIADAT